MVKHKQFKRSYTGLTHVRKNEKKAWRVLFKDLLKTDPIHAAVFDNSESHGKAFLDDRDDWMGEISQVCSTLRAGL